MLDILMLNRENGLFRYYTNANDAEATMDLVRFYSSRKYILERLIYSF